MYVIEDLGDCFTIIYSARLAARSRSDLVRMLTSIATVCFEETLRVTAEKTEGSENINAAQDAPVVSWSVCYVLT